MFCGFLCRIKCKVEALRDKVFTKCKVKALRADCTKCTKGLRDNRSWSFRVGNALPPSLPFSFEPTLSSLMKYDLVIYFHMF